MPLGRLAQVDSQRAVESEEDLLGRDRGGAEGDQKRDADRHHKTRQHVAPEFVGSEPMRGVAGRRETVAQVDLGQVGPRELGAAQVGAGQQGAAQVSLL